jgi:hypothetical protein
MKKYIYSPDKHVGWENRHGKLVPLHDAQAIKVLLKFARDFKPDIWIEGGDNLDCGPVSHWLKDKHKAKEDLDLWQDCNTYDKLVLDPIDAISSIKERHWMLGNHEDWLSDVVEANPGLADALSWRNLLPALREWKLVNQGGYVALGKNLRFIHGDTLGGGINVANNAAQKYKNSIRFGHFHSFQTATRYNPFDNLDVNTAIMVPGLCNKNPNYLKGRPSQWLKGFLYGYIHDDGTFHDAVALIINGKTTIGGKTYSA